MRRNALTLAGAAALAAVPNAAQAAGGGALLSAVNYDRQMAGIEPLTESASLSRSCSLHAKYMAGNGVLTHKEDPGNSLYTEDGAWAGQRSVLARNTAGFTANPWRDAPLHQFQALHPWLQTTGVGVAGNYACMVTLGNRDAPNPDDPRLVSVPGPGQYVPPAQIAREQPFTPGEDVGVKQGSISGPHLYLYAVGPNRQERVVIQNATLTAANGVQAPLRWVDASSANSGPYLTGGAILIPPAPLLESTSYTLRVEAATSSTTSSSRLLISRTTILNTGPNELDPEQFAEAGTLGSAASASTGLVTASQRNRAGLRVSLRWTPHGLRARISCRAGGIRCQGKFRVLVKRKNGVQKLRFVARPGALKLNLRPGRTITRRIDMTAAQRRSGERRGFSVRFSGAAPVKLRSRIGR